jgi:hypothetical protein
MITKKRMAALLIALLAIAVGWAVKAGPASAAAFGPTCQTVSVGSGAVARGCIGGSDTGCNPGTYTISTWPLYNPDEAHGGALGNGNVSGILYTTVQSGMYYSVADGTTGGQTYPLYGLCIDDSSTTKWQIGWKSTSGVDFTWCIYLVPGSGSSRSGAC